MNRAMFGESIKVDRKPDANRFGDRHGGPVDHQIDGVGFAFGASSGVWPADGENTRVSVATLFIPKGADIREGDNVTRLLDGSRWHLDGESEWDKSIHPTTGYDPGYFIRRARRVS